MTFIYIKNWCVALAAVRSCGIVVVLSSGMGRIPQFFRYMVIAFYNFF
jgi:hypothetical protein